MRRAKRAYPIEGVLTWQLAKKASHLSHLERLVQLQRRQHAWKAAREHRLARARRTAHQQVMSARGCNLECSLRLLLPVNFGQVQLGGSGGAR